MVCVSASEEYKKSIGFKNIKVYSLLLIGVMIDNR